MNILVDKTTKEVTRIGDTPNVLEVPIEVPKDFNMKKTVEVQRGTKEKLDEQGNKLYKKPIYETKLNVIGKDETTEDTGVPIMEEVQKEDAEGNLLYLEEVEGTEGQIDYLETTDEYDETGAKNKPLMIEEQKTTISGAPLYWKDITEEEEVIATDENGKELYEEVTERQPTEFSEPLEVVTIPNYVMETKELIKHPKEFSLDEVLTEKYSKMLDYNLVDNIIADLFLSEDDLDLADSNHKANTGVGICEILPLGQVKTKSIKLDVPTSEFTILEDSMDDGVDIYLAGNKFVDGKVMLSEPISSCTIRFENTTNKPKSVRSYAIGY